MRRPASRKIWSPYQNVDPEQAYPLILLMSRGDETPGKGGGDDRVHQSHAAMMQALLEEMRKPSWYFQNWGGHDVTGNGPLARQAALKIRFAENAVMDPWHAESIAHEPGVIVHREPIVLSSLAPPGSIVGQESLARGVGAPERFEASVIGLLRRVHGSQSALQALLLYESGRVGMPAPGRNIEGRQFDVLSFAHNLMALGFVAGVDGRPIPSDPPLPASFPRIRPERVRFALSPVLPVLFAGLMLAAAVALVVRPDLMPSFHDLLWSPRGSAVLALSVGAGWSLVFVHELAHFVTARAAGVHARIQLGTRLQFLIAETDISGIEFAPRRHRLTAYLAGMATNLSVAAVAILLLTMTGEATTAHRILAATLLIAVLPLSFQFMVFMRTDIYFLLQDVTNCRNLFSAGTDYARYIGGRLRHSIVRSAHDAVDPSVYLPRHERRAVRAYSVVCLWNSALPGRDGRVHPPCRSHVDRTRRNPPRPGPIGDHQPGQRRRPAHPRRHSHRVGGDVVATAPDSDSFLGEEPPWLARRRPRTELGSAWSG